MSSASRSPLVSWTESGLYCQAGDFYIDPTRGVDTAVVTHAHSDHARRGSRLYLCATSSVGLMKTRLGANIPIRGIPFGERFVRGVPGDEVAVSLHPAGHILGSAQVRIERGKSSPGTINATPIRAASRSRRCHAPSS
jgi:putative mRNA 3-end processing factor